MRQRTMGRLAAALIIAGVAATPAAAQARGYVGFGAGLALPVGDYSECCKLGWLGQVVAGITGPSGVWGGRIDGMYASNSVKGTGSAKSKLLGVNADIVFTPGARPASMHPYLLGGIGVYNNEFGTFSETKFAFNLGGGLQFHAGGRMDIFTEVRFISIKTTGSSTNLIPISVGLRWGGV